MTAFAIAHVKIHDPEAFRVYGRMFRRSIVPSGGRLLAASVPAEVKEGKWPEGVTVMVEFPSMDKVQEWYDSPKYQEAIAVREQISEVSLAFVDGV